MPSVALRRHFLLALALGVCLLFPFAARAQYSSLSGWCETGKVQTLTAAIPSTPPPAGAYVQGSYPGCTVSIYYQGTTNLVPGADVFSDALGTVLGNPFTASNTSGQWTFFINQSLSATSGANGIFDIKISGGNLPSPVTHPYVSLPLNPANAVIGQLTSTSPAITPTSIEQVRYADQFAGADVTAQIATACADLSGGNGIVAVPSSMGAGALPTLPSGCTVEDQRNNLAWVTSNGTQVNFGVNNVAPGAGHFFPLSVVGTQVKAGSNLNAAGINIAMNVSGDLGNSAGAGSADWGLFSFGNASNLVNNPAFYEMDGTESEATYTGTLATPNNFRLVALGAQPWVNNTTAATTAVVPHAISVWARAPYLNGVTGTGTINDAVSLSADEPTVGTSANHAFELNPASNVPTVQSFLQNGSPLWNVYQADNASVHSYDFGINNANVSGVSLRLQNNANGNAYLTSAGAGSVVINGLPTFGGEGAVTNGTGGLSVYAGGASGSLAPVASVGLIRIPNTQSIVARNNANNGDVTLIGTNASNQVVIDSNNQGTVLGGSLAFGGGASISSSNNVALTTQLPLSGSVAGSTSLLAANSCGDTVTITVTGATTSMTATASSSAAFPATANGLTVKAAVTSSNTVTVGYCNVTGSGITPAAATIQVRVIQ